MSYLTEVYRGTKYKSIYNLRPWSSSAANWIVYCHVRLSWAINYFLLTKSVSVG